MISIQEFHVATFDCSSSNLRSTAFRLAALLLVESMSNSTHPDHAGLYQRE